MPATSAKTPEQQRRRRRRVLGAIPATVVAMGVMSGLPMSAAAPQAGEMHSEIVTLSGPQADALPPASTQAAGSADGAADARAGEAPDEATPGFSAAIDVDDGTQAVAASWIGSDHGAVEVRGEADGTWSEWTELHAEGDEAPDGAARSSGGMAWFGIDGVDRVELRVTEGELADLELQSMRYDEPSGGGTFAAVSAAGAGAAKPEIQPRSSYTSKGWATGNSGCSTGPQQASGGVKYAVVHHTVNANTYAASDVPAMLAAIYTYHTGTNGWCDTAYNFIVDRFGRIWEGRSGGVDKPIVGGHAQGFNTGSVGVSFLGQYEPNASPTAATPSAASIDAASRLIGWKLGLHGVDPTGTVSVTSGGSNRWPAGTVVSLNRVIGHRDVGYTACPGANLHAQLPSIRTKAKAAQTAGTTTTTTTTTPPPPPAALAPFRTASALVTQQYRDFLYRDPSSADLTYWSSRVGTSWSAPQFAAHLVTSSEADDRMHAVTRLYRAYFLRNPDHSGFTYWMSRRGSGQTLSRISSTFAGSSEFTKRYGTLSDARFVDLVYQNVMGRSPDSGGADYWKRKLAAGTSRGQMMINFSQSSEYKDATRDGVLVVGVYESMLRTAVPGNVYSWYTAVLDNPGTSLTDIIDEVWHTDAYQHRFD